ncbi:hypothetical protein [Streptomyces sp. NBC_01443]|uniref:hypothetical protein n=1 Tax=Streptomyces sp. NBC_01443 TaxID=2903868 RepID=UPI002256C731|nr:hypothetical protein [Streptomyces sp. NBC_01443]MCX4633084.1 hypothetical protein [Streptomyces sp. NBC_01443]
MFQGVGKSGSTARARNGTPATDQPGVDFDVRNSYLTLQCPPAKEASAELAAQDGKGELTVAVGGGTFMDAPIPYKIDGTPA